MKKIRKIICCALALLFVAAIIAALSACNPNADQGNECATHTWGEWEEVLTPTCTTEGKEQRVCLNNSEHKEERPIAIANDEHNWGEWIEDVVATCKSEGKEVRVCLNNSAHTEERTTSINPQNHVWGEWEEIVTPTCMNEGSEKRVCLHDNSHEEERTITISSEHHDWGEWEEVLAPTCASEGKEERVCSRDNTHKEERPIAKVIDDHDWGEWEEVLTPTCTSEGKEQRECLNNSEHKEERPIAIANDEHNWGEWEEVLAPTCTSEGKEVRVCLNNSAHTEERTTSINPENHSWGAWNETKLANCTDGGKEKRVCLNDSSHTEERTTSINPENHAWGAWKEVEKPTCTSQGKKQRVCLRNSKHVQEMVISVDSQAHNWGEWQEVEAPTCAEEGKKQRVCLNSDKHVEEEIIPKTDKHSLGSYGACSVCGKQLQTMSVSIAEAPTLLAIYYGEKPTIDGGSVIGEDGKTVEGIWSITTPEDFIGSGSSAIINTDIKVTAKFTPNDTEKYKEISLQLEVTAHAVASYNGVYYNTLEQALTVANTAGSGTVYVLPSNYATETNRAVLAKTISSVNEIKAGVTLSIPFEDTTIRELIDDGLAAPQPAFLSDKTYMTNNVTIGKNLTLVNNGKIEIGGSISGGMVGNSYNSFTASYYSRLTLDSGAKLINKSGNNKQYGITCYGYITEKEDGMSAGIENLGTIVAPFTILEHIGGGGFFGISGLDKADLAGAALGGGVATTPSVTPFNKFYMPNITSFIKNDEGSIYAYVDLYANNQHNETTFPVVGYDSSCLIELKEGSYLTAKLDEVSKITKLDIYGDAELNGMSLDLKVTYSSITANVSLSTEKAFFPLSWMYNVYLHTNGSNSVVVLNQDIKILPGGSLVVDDGVNLKANRIIVYDIDMEATRKSAPGDATFVAESYEKIYTHSGEPILAGKLLVNGVLVVNEFGGYLQSNSIGAGLQLGTSTTVSSKEINYTTGSGLETSASYYTVSRTPTMYIKEGSSTTLQQGVANGVYTFDGQGWVSDNQKLTITFVLGNGEADIVRYVDANTEFTFDFAQPTRDGYTFKGWEKTSGAGTLNGNTSFSVQEENVVLTAKWNKNSCLVEGTMITLADGTQKAIEDITMEDELLVFNHETGKYEVGKLWFTDHAEEQAELRTILNLNFANGSVVRVAYEHAFFDLDLNRYVFITEDNFNEYIGHRFVAVEFDGEKYVNVETVLLSVVITEEVVKVYGPITEYHFNMVAESLLTMPSFNFGVRGFINIFEYDEDLSYNEQKMQEDIEQYGLFTYDDFSDVMSFEDYQKAPMQYFKVSMGKGYLTYQEIEHTLLYLYENGFSGE